MTRIALTEKEAQRILQATKIIRENVVWQLDNNASWAKCSLNVENKLRVNLKMYLNCNNEERSFFSFSLILSNAYCIKRLDVNGSHKNRHADKNLWQGETHKHEWTDICRDSYAYTPDDISGKDIEVIFRQFCNECKVDFQGEFGRVPPQQISLFNRR